MANGCLFYVIGPSGSGKDSLMVYARAQLAGNPKVVFAHRYITRPHDAGGENHVALTEEEFESRLQAGLFAMHWSSHGCHYGIGSEINMWLAKGCNVVMNGSRAHLPYAREQYPELCPLWIQVSTEVLEARLRARGRETGEQIQERLQRAAFFRAQVGDLVIGNDGSLEEAGEKLIMLVSPKATASCA